MPNKKYISGRNAEYDVIKTLKKQGYNCQRGAGSHGVDIFAWKKAKWERRDGGVYQEASIIRAISVKYQKSRLTKTQLKKNFKEIRNWKTPTTISCELWHRQPHQPWKVEYVWNEKSL